MHFAANDHEVSVCHHAQACTFSSPADHAITATFGSAGLSFVTRSDLTRHANRRRIGYSFSGAPTRYWRRMPVPLDGRKIHELEDNRQCSKSTLGASLAAMPPSSWRQRRSPVTRPRQVCAQRMNFCNRKTAIEPYFEFRLSPRLDHSASHSERLFQRLGSGHRTRPLRALSRCSSVRDDTAVQKSLISSLRDRCRERRCLFKKWHRAGRIPPHAVEVTRA